jgi:hypothetical protein
MTSPRGAGRPGMGLAMGVARPGGRRKGAPDRHDSSCLLPGLRAAEPSFSSFGALAVREEETVAGARARVRRRYDPSGRRAEREIEMSSGRRKILLATKSAGRGDGEGTR